MITYAAELRSIPGFERCRHADLAALARSAERLDLPAGYTLLQPGDRRIGAVVVAHGRVVVETDGWTFLLTAGARIERTAPNPRGITVQALTDVRVLALQRRSDDLLPPQRVG